MDDKIEPGFKNQTTIAPEKRIALARAEIASAINQICEAYSVTFIVGTQTIRVADGSVLVRGSWDVVRSS